MEAHLILGSASSNQKGNFTTKDSKRTKGERFLPSVEMTMRVFCASARVTPDLIAARRRLARADRGPLAVASALHGPVNRIAVHPTRVLSSASRETDLIAIKLA